MHHEKLKLYNFYLLSETPNANTPYFINTINLVEGLNDRNIKTECQKTECQIRLD
jgi:hypothetical protein